MMKKTLCMLLALILLLSCFAGCAAKPAEEETPAKENNSAAENQENTENNNTNEPAQDETPVDSLRAYEGTTITVAQNQGEYIWDKLYAIGDKFEELTGIKVEWQDIPSSDWDTWYAAQFAAGTEPDILFSMKDKSSYFDQGKLMDLTDYYEKENPFNGRIWKDCFTDGGLDDCYSADGTRLISTAITFATVNLYYNKDIMNTLGLGDKAPETYSEMFRMMDVAKEDGTYIPMSVMNSMGWNLTWIEDDILDALFHDTDILQKLDIIVPNGWLDESEILLGLKTGVLQYDDPRFIEYFKIMKNFTQYWNQDFNSASWEYESLFNEGKVLFNFNGGWYPGQVIERDIDVNYGTAQKPYVDSDFDQYGLTSRILYTAPAGEANFPVTKKCEDEGRGGAAVLFLQFMTDYQTGAQMYVDAVMLGTCVKDVVLPAEMAEMQNVEYGDAKAIHYQNAFKFNAEVSNLYWADYTAYLDPSSTQSAEDFVEQLKNELLPFLDEAIEDYTTYDVLSYVGQVS